MFRLVWILAWLSCPYASFLRRACRHCLGQSGKGTEHVLTLGRISKLGMACDRLELLHCTIGDLGISSALSRGPGLELVCHRR